MFVYTNLEYRKYDDSNFQIFKIMIGCLKIPHAEYCRSAVNKNVFLANKTPDLLGINFSIQIYRIQKKMGIHLKRCRWKNFRKKLRDLEDSHTKNQYWFKSRGSNFKNIAIKIRDHIIKDVKKLYRRIWMKAIRKHLVYAVLNVRLLLSWETLKTDIIFKDL